MNTPDNSPTDIMLPDVEDDYRITDVFARTPDQQARADRQKLLINLGLDDEAEETDE